MKKLFTVFYSLNAECSDGWDKLFQVRLIGNNPRKK